MPASPASAVGAIVFYITDLDRTEAYYRTVLGLEVMRIGDADHGMMLMAEAGPVNLVFLVEPDKAVGHSPIVVFMLDGGIEEAVESLVRQNVEVVVPVSEAPGGGLSADFLDPDGHVLSYFQPDEASS